MGVSLSPAPAPFRRWVLGRQGAYADRAPPRSLRLCFVCVQIPGAGGGEDGAGGRDGVLAGTFYFGVSRTPASVCLCWALEGWSGGNEPRWACPGWTGGAIPKREGLSEPARGGPSV